MKTTETAKSITFASQDDNGDFEIKILKSQIPQIQIKTHGLEYPDETYVNVNINELRAIRDMFDKVINLYGDHANKLLHR